MRRLTFLLAVIISIFGCSREMDVALGPDTNPPAPPQGLYVYFAGDGMVILVWQSNREPDLAFYKIYRGVDSVNFSYIDRANENNFADKGLDYDTIYYYYVTAVDNSGNESAPSSIVSAKPINIYPPEQPFGLSVNAHNDPDGIYFDLSWYKNPDGDIKFYKIFRSRTPNFPVKDSNLVGISSVNFYRDTFNLSINQRYYYKIVAVDKGGLESKPSYEDSDIILKSPELLQPEDKSVIDYNVVFKWKRVENANGYVVLVSTSRFGNEIWRKVIYSQSNADTISVAYTGPSLYNGKTYFWKIATFTKSDNIINSLSEIRSFIISVR